MKTLFPAALIDHVSLAEADIQLCVAAFECMHSCYQWHLVPVLVKIKSYCHKAGMCTNALM